MDLFRRFFRNGPSGDLPPHADRATVWALATAACLVSGDYRKARETAPQLPVT